MTKKNDTRDFSLPLAEAFPIHALKGWLSKHLVVPPGRQGIALFRDGRTQFFPSGENRVITDLDRLKGLGAGFWAGYLPSGTFPVMLAVNNLLSGDEQLLDLSLLCSARVSDPARFFTDMVIPRRKVSGKTLLVDEPELFKSFANLVHTYASIDLIQGDLDADLINKALALLSPVLKAQGLTLENIDLVTCWRQEDRLLIDQQVYELEQKKADLKFEQELAQAEAAGKLNEFLKANGVKLNARQKAETQAKADRKSQGQVMDNWLEGKKSVDQPGRNFRVHALVDKVPPQQAKVKNKVRWWIPRTIWIIAVILIGVAMTIAITIFADQMGWKGKGEIYFTIWVFVLGTILESVAALYKNWEKHFKNEFEVGAPITLDQLRIKDRATVDRIVREQCQMELGLQRDILNETRSRIYQAGLVEQALLFRRIEKKIEDYQEKVKEKSFGVAPYLSPDITLSRETWASYMENDELLLIEAGRLTEKAQRLQANFNQVSVNDDVLADYEVSLDGFYKSFAVRERVLFSGKVNQDKKKS